MTLQRHALYRPAPSPISDDGFNGIGPSIATRQEVSIIIQKTLVFQTRLDVRTITLMDY